MAGIYTRHPRFSLFILISLILTYYLLFSPSTPFSLPSNSPNAHNGNGNANGGGITLPPGYQYTSDLPGRVKLSTDIYNAFLKDRAALIEKHGPTPADLVPFPPNKSPWPPYTVWDFFVPTFNCPHEVRRIGALGDGGKFVCGLSRLKEKRDCVIYSVGINYESSFEAGLLGETKYCEVWGYDFSVKDFGPEVPSHLKHRAHFYRYGMAGRDGKTSDGLYPLYTLSTLLKLNKHTHIDILKVDIESWEFETFETILREYRESGQPLPFAQLQLEIHLWNKSFADFLKWWEGLEEMGLRPFWTEPNLVYQNYNGEAALAEYSFLNIQGDNIFIADPAPPPPVPNEGGERGYTARD